jgi:hypothetical protein
MKILGINDEVTTCECCGKTNLKKTVVLGTETGELRYGTSCAARALLGNDKQSSQKIITTQASAVSLAQKWLKAGHTAEVVAKGIWNRFGYLTEAKGGMVLIGKFATVKA